MRKMPSPSRCRICNRLYDQKDCASYGCVHNVERYTEGHYGVETCDIVESNLICIGDLCPDCGKSFEFYKGIGL